MGYKIIRRKKVMTLEQYYALEKKFDEEIKIKNAETEEICLCDVVKNGLIGNVEGYEIYKPGEALFKEKI